MAINSFVGVSGLNRPMALKGNFNYGSAYGQSPYQPQINQIGNWINQANPGKILGFNGGAGMAGSGWHVANPNDPEVGQYMAKTGGETENLLNRYVGRAAGAGITRAGVGVGNGGYASQLHQDAMNNLAGSYANRFREAMDYNKYRANTLNDYTQMAGRNLVDVLGLQNNLLGRQGDWQMGIGNAMRQDYGSDADTLNNAWEQQRQWGLDQQDRNRQMDQYDTQRGQQQRLQQLLQQATLQHSGGTSLNSGLVEYLRQMGMLPSTAGSAGKGNSWMQGIRGF